MLAVKRNNKIVNNILIMFYVTEGLKVDRGASHHFCCLYDIIHLAIDGFNYRGRHYKNYHVTKTGSHFVGQKGNQINRVSLIIQC